MAFEIKNFTTVGGQARKGNSPAIWSYKSTTDGIITILADDYFDLIGTRVSPGDFIYANVNGESIILNVSSITFNPTQVVIDQNVISGNVPVFSIIGIPDLSLWLDASEESSIHETTDNVDIWDDISLNDNDAAQTGIKRPITGIMANDVNGLNTIAFDDFDAGLEIPPDVSHTGTWVKGGTLIVMHTSITDGGNDNGVFLRHPLEWRIFKSSVGSQVSMAHAFSGDDALFRSEKVFPIDVPHILSVLYDGSSADNVPSFYRNTVLLETIESNIPTGVIEDVSETMIVGNNENFENGVDSEIGEILLFKRLLSAAELEFVHDYLIAKWNIV